DYKKLLAGIADAFSGQQAKVVAVMNRDQVERLLSTLTPRELEVMDRVVAGLHNREIAAELGISPRTVEVHKARMMDKLGVSNIADLVRLSLQSGNLDRREARPPATCRRTGFID
ncbi:MAG: LuxR C-terminal-related transcriptional regulator, partial [Azonexus sp.]|nr:LuxR C-terminal-related transcriptional regulator [Azonexus sp.]